MAVPFRVHLIGFSDFERGTLGTYFRLAQRREPAYQQVVEAGQAQLLVVDADRPAAVAAAAALGTPTRTVYVGATAPDGALALVPRPIDPNAVVRELDAMVAAQSRRPPPAPAPAAPQPPPRPTPPVRRRPGATALIVDDSEVAARFLEVKLHPYGLRTERVADAAAALAALAQRRFDFVFLDIELGPDSRIGGLELCQRIKRAPAKDGEPAPPVVALVSAHAGSVDRVQGALAGADGHLGKPLDEAALEQWLALHGVLPSAAPQPN